MIVKIQLWRRSIRNLSWSIPRWPMILMWWGRRCSSKTSLLSSNSSRPSTWSGFWVRFGKGSTSGRKLSDMASSSSRIWNKRSSVSSGCRKRLRRMTDYPRGFPRPKLTQKSIKSFSHWKCWRSSASRSSNRDRNRSNLCKSSWTQRTLRTRAAKWFYWEKSPNNWSNRIVNRNKLHRNLPLNLNVSNYNT